MSMVSAVHNVCAIHEIQSSESLVLGDLNFRSKNGIQASSNIQVVDAKDVVWNEVCKTSHKWDVYPLDVRENHEVGSPSYLTFDIDLSQMNQSKVELKFFGCTREDLGRGWVTIEINGVVAEDKAPVYDGPDFNIPSHLVEKNDGKAFDHLDETTVDISDFVQKGMNRITFRLHPETETGISVRWIEIVQSN